jgi:hypothetical protein
MKTIFQVCFQLDICGTVWERPVQGFVENFPVRVILPAMPLYCWRLRRNIFFQTAKPWNFRMAIRHRQISCIQLSYPHIAFDNTADQCRSGRIVQTGCRISCPGRHDRNCRFTADNGGKDIACCFGVKAEIYKVSGLPYILVVIYKTVIGFSNQVICKTGLQVISVNY